MGSNGLTSARHDMLNSSYKSNFPESFDSLADSDFFYTGNFNLTDTLPETDISIGKAILSPTRTYAPLLKEIIKNHRKQIIPRCNFIWKISNGYIFNLWKIN